MLFKVNAKLILKLLLGFKTGFTSLILKVFNNLYTSIGFVNNFQMQIEIHLNYLYPLLLFCKKHSLYLFNILIDLICYEFLGRKHKYILIYTLLNIRNTLRLLIKIKIPEWTKNLLSITSLFYNAGWLEREVFDFFGIYFFFNKDLRRILLDYGFIGHPLRKDFPLSGFIELFYDDSIKKIIYERVTLCQEYRIFLSK